MIRSSIIRKIVIEEFENIKKDGNLIIQSDLDEEELGGGYSIEFNTMPENDFVKESFDHIIKSEVQNYILKENAIADFAEATVNNIFQYVATAVVQYGITAAGLAAAPVSAGASAPSGAAAGAAAKTAIDGAIALRYVNDAISIFEFLKNDSNQLESVFKNASNLSNYVNDLDKFYKENTKMIQKSFNLFGSSGKLKAQSALLKMKKTIYEALTKLVVIISKIVGVLIPDATISTAVKEFIVGLGLVISDNPFTILKGIKKVLGSYADFFFKSDVVMSYVKMAIPASIEIFNKIADKIENNDSSFSVTDVVSPQIGLAKKAAELVTPKILRSVASYIQSEQSNIISVVEKIVEIIIPTFVSLVATYQALANGDVNIEVSDLDTSPNSSGPDGVAPAVQAQTTPSAAPTNAPTLAEMKKELGKLNKRLQVLNEKKSRRHKLYYA
jgi:hypothetical protein